MANADELRDANPWHPMSDAVDLKHLGKLAEELSEAGAAVARCIIQGIDEKEPVTGKINREWLQDELADVIANIIRDIPGIKPSIDGHPTPKPVRLFSRFIEWHSLPGEVVLDPFLGGGTTAEAAKRAGRKCIGFELEERWLEMAAKRCRQEVLL